MKPSMRVALIVAAVATLCSTLTLMASAAIDPGAYREAKRRLQIALDAGDTAAAVQAIREVARGGSADAVNTLVGVGVSLESARIYDAVRDGLQGMRQEAAVAYMVRSLGSRSAPAQWPLRCVLLEGLIPHEGERVTEAMAAALEDRVGYVVSAAAKALGERRDPAAVPALIDALARLERQKDVPWIDTRQALTDITGEDYADASQWRDYWQVVGPEFDVDRDRGAARRSSTVVRDSEASQFFEEQLIASRIFFIIDVSGSMDVDDPPIEGEGGGNRMERVKEELIRAIEGLGPHVSFNILAYSHEMRPWRPLGKGARLHQANARNKRDATQWVSALRASGGTYTNEALEKAFEIVEVNTIILLSDGAPNDPVGQGGIITTDQIVENVRGMNRIRGVKIHTFCFEIFKSQGLHNLLRFMERLAEDNGGGMTLIR